MMKTVPIGDLDAESFNDPEYIPAYILVYQLTFDN